MAKGLFDHIKAITNEQDPKYFDKLEDADKKSWSNFMVIRYMTMHPDWVTLISELQPTIQELPPKLLYKVLISVVPKGRHFLKYMKGSKSEQFEKWIVELVAKYYEVSITEAEDYMEILLKSKEGNQKVKEIAEAYGTDTKLITKLKLKV
jgi:hypothetical protein